MKKETILKIMTLLIMGVVLFTMSTSVFALEDDDFYLDITDSVNTNTGTNTGTDTNTDTNTGVDTNLDTNTGTNTDQKVDYNTELPEAGLAENTIMGIAIVLLAGVAVITSKKVKEYKNI